jgi:hypothetical protein
MRRSGDSWASLADEARRFAGDSEVLPFETLRDPERVRQAEVFVQAVVRKLLGDGRRALLTVSHRDQAGHNPEYHVHRLVWTEEPSAGPGL